MRLQGLLEGGTSGLMIWGVWLTPLHEKGQRWMGAGKIRLLASMLG